MFITSYKTTIKTVKSGDPLWMISDGMFQAPRAHIEIDSKCPKSYSKIIQECINNGWLRPVANITEKDAVKAYLTQS